MIVSKEMYDNVVKKFCVENQTPHDKSYSTPSGGKGGSDACDDYEGELAAIREDLVDSINAWVVKAAADSPLKADFNPGDKPTIVFFRDGVPVLYNGPANDEEMLETLAAYKAGFFHMTPLSGQAPY